MGPFQDSLSHYEAGVASPMEKVAEAWGVFNWSSVGSWWAKQVSNSASDSKTRAPSPAPQPVLHNVSLCLYAT